MDDALPSITSNPGSVGSRFISQDDIESAKARKDEQWKAAYARLGQEPPPQPTEDIYDGRSLAEKLAANKIAKQEEWEEKNRLANQFRALEEDEVLFLDTIRAEEERKELKRKRDDAEEVKGFMEAVAARNTLPDKPPTSAPPTQPSRPKASLPTVTKKSSNVKNSLKGVVVKKKFTKPAASTATTDPSSGKTASKGTGTTYSRDAKQTSKPDNTSNTAKKPRLSPSSSSD